MNTLIDFINESNIIEGIHREATNREINAFKDLLHLPELTVKDIEDYVWQICKRKIRNFPGRNVTVGSYTPPPGGPEIECLLNAILYRVNKKTFDPYTNHINYEKIHPFMDGNGRSGRAIWAWQKQQEGYNPFHLGFLHTFYYETLSHS